MSATVRPRPPLVPAPRATLKARGPAAAAPERGAPAVDVKNFDFCYGPRQVLRNLSFAIERKSVTAIIGPSGCGKSTFLRSINRLNDLIAGVSHNGDILVEGQSVYSPGTDLVALRQRVGMVFQRPNPFPKTIFDNVAYGPALNRLVPKRDLPDLVERCLRQAAL
nr:ATP-binding cassette domain-containing protein [Gemmatimonadales bacterium]